MNLNLFSLSAWSFADRCYCHLKLTKRMTKVFLTLELYQRGNFAMRHGFESRDQMARSNREVKRKKCGIAAGRIIVQVPYSSRVEEN